MSAVFSLNGAVAEPSRGESARQVHLAVDTAENVIRGGGDSADRWATDRNQDKYDGAINCQPFIGGLLIRKLFFEKQKQVIHSVKPETSPTPGMSALNRVAGWNELLPMVDQRKLISSCGIISA